MFKFNNKDTRTFDVFIVNFEHTSDLFLVTTGWTINEICYSSTAKCDITAKHNGRFLVI